MTFRTRFAPSPTGPLHLGHAYSAMLGFDMAMAEGGEWLLRIEDIDQQRSKPEWEAAFHKDLEWLGLWWPEPVMRQSERGEAYGAAILKLWREGWLYPCTCTRADIAAAASAPQADATPAVGADGLIYPGTCKRGITVGERFNNPPPRDAALRLHIRRPKDGEARVVNSTILSFREMGHWPTNHRHHQGLIEFTLNDLDRDVGDPVIARRGMGTSYHLSVVLDDAAQGVTHVVRGQDLFEATKIHVVLQRLLGLPTPVYHHHRLIRDDAGRRLAKREDAKAIRRFREEGASPANIRRMVGLGPPLAL